MRRFSWTDEELSLLRSFVTDGFWPAVIETVIKRRGSSIRKKAIALGLQLGELPGKGQWWERTFRSLHAKGFSLTEIAERMTACAKMGKKPLPPCGRWTEWMVRRFGRLLGLKPNGMSHLGRLKASRRMMFYNSQQGEISPAGAREAKKAAEAIRLGLPEWSSKSEIAIYRLLLSSKGPMSCLDVFDSLFPRKSKITVARALNGLLRSGCVAFSTSYTHGTLKMKGGRTFRRIKPVKKYFVVHRGIDVDRLRRCR